MSNSTIVAVLVIGVGAYGAYKYSQNHEGGSKAKPRPAVSQSARPKTAEQRAADQKAKDNLAEDRARGIGGY